MAAIHIRIQTTIAATPQHLPYISHHQSRWGDYQPIQALKKKKTRFLLVRRTLSLFPSERQGFKCWSAIRIFLKKNAPFERRNSAASARLWAQATCNAVAPSSPRACSTSAPFFLLAFVLVFVWHVRLTLLACPFEYFVLFVILFVSSDFDYLLRHWKVNVLNDLWQQKSCMSFSFLSYT